MSKYHTRKTPWLLWSVVVLCAASSANGKSVETQSNGVVAGSILVASGAPTRDGWTGLPTYGADGSDKAAPNDFAATQVANDDKDVFFHVTMNKSEPYGFRHNIYIDVDQNRNTGFVGQGSGYLAMGVDYLIQGNGIFKFTAASQTGWDWQYVDRVSSDMSSATDIALRVPRSAIPNVSKFDFSLYAANFDLGKDEDYYPNSSFILGGGFFTYAYGSVVGIDELTHAVATGSSDTKYDLNHDGGINQDDRTYWVRNVAHTHFGDANLNQVVDSEDIIQVFQGGQYEDNIAGNSLWATGDWNGDLDFTSDDLVWALQDGGLAGPVTAVSAVPEPQAWLLLTAGVMALLARGRRQLG